MVLEKFYPPRRWPFFQTGLLHRLSLSCPTGAIWSSLTLSMKDRFDQTAVQHMAVIRSGRRRKRQCRTASAGCV
jgi:hypothetical protein